MVIVIKQTSTTPHKIYVHGLCFILLCLSTAQSAHILQAFFSDNRAVKWLPQCQKWPSTKEVDYKITIKSIMKRVGYIEEKINLSTDCIII